VNKKIYAFMTTGAAIGMIAAFLQTLEKIELLKNNNAVLPCDLNSVFSCSTVLNAWQSSVFGFPNSIMCFGLFTIFFAIGLAGLNGTFKRGLRLSIQALSLATLVFALWFLWQSTFVIGALCIFCIFCFIGLLMINGAWLRLNVAEMPIHANGKAWLFYLVRHQYDVLIWLTLGLIVAGAMIIKFM
jgi:uncharacterized membrane protein